MKTHKSWREKLEKEQAREIVDDPTGRGKMLIPRPLDVDAVIRRVERENQMIQNPLNRARPF